LAHRSLPVDRGVRDVDFTLRRGGSVVVTGPVGSGKTTLLRTLLGLIPRDAGEIAWNGRVVDDPSTFMTPPRCAYTAQSPRQRAAAARMFVRGRPAGVRRRLQRSRRRHRADALAAPVRRRSADEIVVLDEGRIVARGDADALLARSPLFRRIWGEND